MPSVKVIMPTLKHQRSTRCSSCFYCCFLDKNNRCHMIHFLDGRFPPISMWLSFSYQLSGLLPLSSVVSFLIQALFQPESYTAFYKFMEKIEYSVEAPGVGRVKTCVWNLALPPVSCVTWLHTLGPQFSYVRCR